jgi:hypothetical protein
MHEFDVNEMSERQITAAVVIGFVVVMALAVTALYFGIYAHY